MIENFAAGKTANGISYDQNIYRCEMGELIGKCRGMDYYFAYEQCVDGVVVDKEKSSSSLGDKSDNSSSSSVEDDFNPYSSSSETEPSSSSIDNGLCADFVEGTEIEHYGKFKPQFCDERDGKRYVYVTIGEGETAQTWMAENLNYNASGSVCYNNSENYCNKYGRLYAGRTADEVCP